MYDNTNWTFIAKCDEFVALLYLLNKIKIPFVMQIIFCYNFMAELLERIVQALDVWSKVYQGFIKYM